MAGTPWLAAAVAFVWGGAGGSLYTLAMIDIGSREEGITLVNSTAVLVLSYTLGGVLAPALGAAMLDWAPVLGFPALLLAGGGAGLVVAARRQPRSLIRAPRWERSPPAVQAPPKAPAQGPVCANRRTRGRPGRRRSTCPPV